MMSAHALEIVALALALTGLLAVIAEILVKDPGLLVGRPSFKPTAPLRPLAGSFRPGAVANSNESRKAA
jgi:hypothetical protein